MQAKLYKLWPLGKQKQKNSHRLHEWRVWILEAPFCKISQIYIQGFWFFILAKVLMSCCLSALISGPQLAPLLTRFPVTTTLPLSVLLLRNLVTQAAIRRGICPKTSSFFCKAFGLLMAKLLHRFRWELAHGVSLCSYHTLMRQNFDPKYII